VKYKWHTEGCSHYYQTITIKKEDKGAGIVVMNTSEYEQKAMTQLADTNTYTQNTDTQKQLQHFLHF